MSRDTDKVFDRLATAAGVESGFAGEEMYDVSDDNDSSSVSEDVSCGETVGDRLNAALSLEY